MPRNPLARVALLSMGLALGLVGGPIAQAANPGKATNQPAPATDQAMKELPFPAGDKWLEATDQAKLAYLLGIMNLAMVEYQLTGPNPTHRTTTEKLVESLNGMTLRQIMEAVDTYYKAHPDRQQQPIIEVIWFQLVKPNSGARNMR